MAEQARTAYEKVLTILAAAGFGPADVTRITENVTIAGLADYAAAAAVRQELFGGHRPVVRTVVVDRLIRRTALLEVELHAVAGGGAELLAASEPRPAGAWRPSPVREGHDGAVYLPTVLPVDAAGEVVHPGDFVGQYAYCLDRAGRAPGGRRAVARRRGDDVRLHAPRRPATSTGGRTAVRKDRLGGAGVFPGAGGILMSRLHQPGRAGRPRRHGVAAPAGAVNPGWSRYDTLTYTPGVKAGRTLYMSRLRRARHGDPGGAAPGRLGAQAEATYGAILAAAGLRRAGARRTCWRRSSTASRRRCPTYRAVAGGARAAAVAAVAGVDRRDLRRRCCGPSSCSRSSRRRCTRDEPADRRAARAGRPHARLHRARSRSGRRRSATSAMAIGDDNPLYSDAAFARAHGLPGSPRRRR